MKKLNEMTKKELQILAAKKGLVLSYKDENGKRQRYTVEQLIKNIEKTFQKEVKEKSQFEYFVEYITNSKNIFELNAIKNEIKKYLKQGMKSKSKILKSKVSKEYNQLLYMIQLKNLTLKADYLK